jgi:hypothetical protein
MMAALGWLLNLGFAGGTATAPVVPWCVDDQSVYVPGDDRRVVYRAGDDRSSVYVPGDDRREVVC